MLLRKVYMCTFALDLLYDELKNFKIDERKRDF
jgi:hypothetical protein